MVLISSVGGSGSSFVAEEFRKHFWDVCLRPDGGGQKATHTKQEIFLERTKPFYDSWTDHDTTLEQMFKQAYVKLSAINNPNLMLLSMTWGGLGLLNVVKEKPIFLVRDPIFAFNSYSGGGWRKGKESGGSRRIKYVKATGPNDRKWIDLWLGDFAHWIDTTSNAIRAVQDERGYIVRYHNFKEDWSKIPNVPPIHLNFSSKDNPEKLEGFLNQDSIDYIRQRTDTIWNTVCEL